ncbi:MAG: LppP/LprE family lipoprotein [Mycobacterium sp.]
MAMPASDHIRLPVAWRGVWAEGVLTGQARRVIGGAALVIAVLAAPACGSGDSTVSQTPEATVTNPTTNLPDGPASPPPPPPPPPSEPADPCAIDLAAPAIVKAVSELPKDPRSGQAWNPEPIAGNYNACAQLSAVIIKANTNADNPNTRAVLFHQGNFIPAGVPDTFGFNGLDTSQSTGDTVALQYSSQITGLASVVKFRWNGSGVELIGNTG